MRLTEGVLQKKAKKRELKALQKNKVIPERIAALEGLLRDVYVLRRPKQSDYHYRKDLIRVFNVIAKEIYGKCNDHPVVKEFGSFTMDIFSPKSDLDLSINFSSNLVEVARETKIKTLRKFSKKFYALLSKGHVSSVHPILTANVPILKVIDSGTGIECDLSVENRDGILKSQIVHVISSIDERFQKLSFLMKAWAKAHNINSSKDHTLNSLSIVLLVAFHLQTRDPPILPPLSVILKDGTDRATVSKVVKQFVNYGKSNEESLADLFVTLLIKLSSVEKLWSKGLCASTYQGSWTSKTWNSKVGCFSVEDFTDRSQNVSKAVAKDQVKRINSCIQHSIQYVAAFMDGQIQGPRLRDYLFGREATTTITTSTRDDNKKLDKKQVGHQIPLLDHIPKKRLRATVDEQGWGRMCGGRSWADGPSTQVWTGAPSTQVWAGPSMQGWGGASTAVQGWGGTSSTATQGWGGRSGANGGWGGGTASQGWGGMKQQQKIMGWGGWAQQASDQRNNNLKPLLAPPPIPPYNPSY
ncbi:hypothetical protein LguiA_013387 [Lonicera macranthoides]